MQRTHSDPLYFLMDGDKVGDRIELHLLDNRTDQAAALSARISAAIAELAHEVEALGGEVLYGGGDDLFGRVPAEKLPLIDSLRSQFHVLTGCTLSVGIGVYAADAVMALHRAKLLGGDRSFTIRGEGHSSHGS